MKEKNYFLFLQTCCSLVTVSSLVPSNFERTKAEDIDGSHSGEYLNKSSSCDMTSQFCDINCCNDQDCSELEKRSFKCSNHEYEGNSPFSYLLCENLGSLNSFGNPLLCLHDQNTPYLGDFFEKDENFTSYSFNEILKARNKEISNFRIIDIVDYNYKNKFKRGSNIFFLDNLGHHHGIYIFSNLLSKGNGYCSKVPMRFLIDEMSSCFFTMDEEQCLLNEEFHLQHHLNNLKQLELLGDINDVNITFNVVCLRDETGFVTFHQDLFHGGANKNTSIFDISECESYALTEVDKNKTICKNVVVGLNYSVNVNGSVLRSLIVQVITVNIPLIIKGDISFNKTLLDPLFTTKKYPIHVLQKTSVKFEYTDFIENIKKHGYALGNPVFLGG